jgi:hypothetical protein
VGALNVELWSWCTMLKIWDKKNRSWTVFFVLAIGLALSVFAFNSSRVVREDHVVDQNLITEVQARRKTNSAAIIDISDIVNKYMRTEITQKSAEDYLTDLGFKIVYDKPSLKNGEFHLIFEQALSDKSSTSSLGFHDEVRVFVTVENGLTSKLSGKLFFKAL